MRTCYELYSDERYHPGNRYLILGGVICTMYRREQLVQRLTQVRATFNLTREMHWEKVSKAYLGAYKAWADAFLQDDLARFSLFVIDTSDPTWKNFNPRANRTSNRDEKLASAFYQFLLVSFGGIYDTMSWGVYSDKGFFSKDTVVDRVSFLLNRVYKRAYGPKRPRVIHSISAQDSKKAELIQLTDVLLGSLSYSIVPIRDVNHELKSAAKLDLVEYCKEAIGRRPKDKYNRDKIAVRQWVPPEQFSYR